MKVYTIFLNGIYSNDVDRIKEMIKDSIIIAVDGGTNFCFKHGINVSCVIGDMDSISDKAYEYYKSKAKIIKAKKEKDYTDFELALKYISNQSFDDIDTRFKNEIKNIEIKEHIQVFGATGARVDMTLSNLKKLHMAKNMCLVSENFEIIRHIKLDNCEYVIKNLKNRTFSIIPTSDIKKLSLKGFYYPLENVDIAENVSLASNIVIDDIAIISCVSGSMYIVSEECFQKI